jgi:iron complex outermembrane receptor protein
MNFKRLLIVTLAFCFATLANAQDKTVTGKVTDSKDGSALQGVTIAVKGTKIITQTSADGSFKIKVPASATTFSLSSIGFATQEVAIGTSDVFVKLVQNNASLNEVVVIGYGTARKKDLTGAVTTVSSKDFVKGAITTPEQLIAGKVAGVSITPNGGSPGSGSVIRIRGGASLNASNDPLIVVDGVPLDNGGIAGSPNALSLINPNDIETFTILKDASSTAIYGSRASNGVIIITTKKGTSGKPRWAFNTNNSAYNANKKVDVLTADEIRTYVNARGTTAEKATLGSASTDWQDVIYKTALATDNNLSVSGTYKKLPYRVSGGYLNQDGILRTGNLQRTSLALVLSPRFLKDALKLDINLKASNSKSRFANEGAIGSAVTFDPTKPVYSGSKRFNGYWEWLDPANTATGLLSLSPTNPLGLLEQIENKSNVNRSIGNIQLDYSLPFLKGLRININAGYDVAKGSGTTVLNDSAKSGYKRFISPTGTKGGANNQYNQTKSNNVLDAYLNYVKETNAGRFDFTTGYSYQAFKSTGDNFPDRTFDGTIVNTPVFTTYLDENRLIGIYGRLNYSYKGKYLLTAAIRRDASSRFAKENRWGNFPSVALGWRIKDEGFLKTAKNLSELKIRVGFGITGQQDGIGNYSYIGDYSTGGNQSRYQLGNTYYNTLSPNGYNDNIKWEQTEMYNAALEFGFLNNRISGTLEYYNRNTKDLLNSVSVPAGSNFTNILTANVGTLKNEGVEFSLNTGIVRQKDITWDLAFNVTYNKNTITNLTLSPDPNFVGNQFGGISGGTGQQVLINSIGFPRGAFYAYKQAYTKSGDPIDGLFADLDRDGTINEKDLYRYKQVDPVVFLGVSSNFSYKKFSAGFVMRGNVGNYLYNNVNSSTATQRNIINPLRFINNASRNVLSSNFSGNGSQYYLSDYYIENASFLRMDNINIGYNVGKVFNNKADLRIGANIQNAFVITKYSGLDPEVSGGIDNNLYPRPRVYVLTIGLNF